MNLAKLILLACPVVLTSMLVGTVPAYASGTASFLQAAQVDLAQTVVNSAIPGFASLRSDRPLVPTGCGCTQCIKAEQLLQSRLPGL